MIGFSELTRDITQRKQTQKALKNVHEELERLVEERTAELVRANEQLNQEIERHKQRKDILRKSEEKFSKLFQASPAYISLVTLEEGCFLAVNDAFEKNTGYKQSEIIGRTVYELGLWADPDDRDKYVKLIKEKGQLRSQRITLVRKDGKLYEGLWSAERIEIDGEDCIISVFDDITQLVKVQDAVNESEKRYRTLVEESFDGIFIQKGTKIEFTNKRLNGMLGYKEGELIGVDHWLLYHSDYQQIVKEWARARMSGEKDLCPIEVKLQRKDGSWLYGEINSRAIDFPSDGEPRIQVWLKDIMKRKVAEEALQKARDDLELQVDKRTADLAKTNRDLKQEIEERKRAEVRLSESEERYRRVVDDMPEMVCRFLPDGTLNFVNKTFYKQFETEPGELIGKNFFQFIPPEEREMVRDNLNSLNSKRPVARFIHKIFLSDGAARLHRWSDRALFGETGSLVEYQAMGRDITEEMLAQEERSRLERRLRQTQKMEAIGVLSAGIAHEFNNILAIIIGNVQLAMEDVSETNRARGNLEEIHGVALRAVDMVKQILAFCRGGEQQLEPLRPTPIIKESVKFLESSIPATIEIRQNIGEADPICADPTQITQILLNLFTNAAYAMENSGILEVGVENINLDKGDVDRFDGLAPGKYVKLTVSDTGIGIAPGVINRIFDPYFTTKKVGEGSGMGLAVVHGIVENHGGAILVNSKPGKGTTFSVFFPSSEAEKTDEIEGTEKSPKGNERILKGVPGSTGSV